MTCVPAGPAIAATRSEGEAMRLNANLTKTIITVCAGAALAVAQNQPAGSTASQAGSTAGSQGQYTPVEKHAGHDEHHGMNSAKGAGLMVNQQDQQFMIDAAQGGLMEVEAARL